jgi:hypothetical protein
MHHKTFTFRGQTVTIEHDGEIVNIKWGDYSGSAFLKYLSMSAYLPLELIQRIESEISKEHPNNAT